MATSFCGRCHRTFAGIVAFDAHRAGTFSHAKRRCLNEQEMRAQGMFQNDKGWWAVPSAFGTDKMKKEEGGYILMSESLGKLIPFGYAVKDADQQLAELMRDEKALLVDIRYNAVSRFRPQWNGKALREAWSERYFPLSALGNVNYHNDGPIKLSLPEIGIPLLVEGVQKGCTLILLCACKDYEACHRKVVVDLVRQVLPDVVVIRIRRVAAEYQGERTTFELCAFYCSSGGTLSINSDASTPSAFASLSSVSVLTML